MNAEPLQASAISPVPLFEEYCCPRCKGNLTYDGAQGNCSKCGQSVQVLGATLVDFCRHDDGAEASGAEASGITSWPDGFAALVNDQLLTMARGEAISQDARAKLAEHGIVDSNSQLTPLGKTLRYFCKEEAWQARDQQFAAMVQRTGLGRQSCVLDVGCGAGQSLFVLSAQQPRVRVGVDIYLEGLAFGARLATCRMESIHFARASGTALPFRDGQFTHIICRGAINYMHQRQAMGEITRVLRPGGYLYLRFERLWHDLRCVAHSRGVREFLCRSRDLGFGLLHTLSGWQPRPGPGLLVGRAYATVGRLNRWLQGEGCEVVSVEENTHSTPFLGKASQITLLARRRSS
jgi:SAM-dependent methyltransferase